MSGTPGSSRTQGAQSRRRVTEYENLVGYGGSLLGTAACDGAGHVFLTRGANDPSRPTRDFWELTIKAG